MNTEAEDPRSFHQRMWREHGPKHCPIAFDDRVTGDALSPDYYNGFQAGVEYAEPRVRDAALEEAAQVVAGMYKWGPPAWGTSMDAIRALKSKPAQATLEPCEVPGCVDPRGHVVRLFHPDVNGEPIVIQFEGKLKPEPVHDFGWALQQMRAGKKVRRKNESGTISLHANGFGFGGNDILLTSGDLLATDWEVAE